MSEEKNEETSVKEENLSPMQKLFLMKQNAEKLANNNPKSHQNQKNNSGNPSFSSKPRRK